MIVTSDLVPQLSGISNLGLEVTGGLIVPYGHVHLISGVWADSFLGQSGLLRFRAGSFEMSENGGILFSGVTLTNTRTLQDLYEADHQMRLLINDLGITSDTAKCIFTTNGTLAPFMISAGGPTSFSDGDLFTTQESNLRRFLSSTGSGVVNFLFGSGIIQPKAVTNQTPPKTGDLATDIKFDSVLTTSVNYINMDRFFGYDPTGTSSDIRIMTSGLYECTYNVAFDRTGLTPQLSTCFATLDSVEISRSRAFAFHDSTSDGENTCCARFLFNANAGQIFRIRGGYGTNTDVLNANTINTIANVVGAGTPTVRGGVFFRLRKLGAKR